MTSTFTGTASFMQNSLQHNQSEHNLLSLPSAVHTFPNIFAQMRNIEDGQSGDDHPYNGENSS